MTETSEMNVYKKLQLARILLQNTKLSKSGHNKFAGYDYFELPDFLPAIQNICEDVGLCGVFHCDQTMAYLTIFNTESKNDLINFSAPMSSAALKGCHDVQNLGAVISYLRRYLWVNAFEIVEHDALDATTGAAEPAKKVTPVTPKTVEGASIGTKPKAVGDWVINMNAGPDTGIEDWLAALWDGATVALSMAGSDADVMAIFKKNKTLFDEAKAKDAGWFKRLMEEFTKTKDKFKEAA